MFDFEQLQLLFDEAPSIKLMRQRTAPLMLAFFYKLFKQDNRLVVEEYDFLVELADFLETYEVSVEEQERSSFEDRAKMLARKWSSADTPFLKASENEDNQLVYELSTFSERVLQWLEQLQQREFVGTESRFKAIFQKIQELLAYTNTDIGQRIKELEAEKKRIDKEIAKIKLAGEVETFDDYQIKSRLHDINSSAKMLLGDFQEVEENFKQITRSIYQKHTDPQQRKGGILAYTFDALDELRESDQGRSFYAFRDFLFNRSDKASWQDMTKELGYTLDSRAIRYDIRFLQGLKMQLFRASEKVVNANRKMSEKLTRVISEKELAERLRVKAASSRIKTLALEWAQRKEQPQVGIEIELPPELNFPLERKLTLEKKVAKKFDQTPQRHKQAMDKDSLLHLAQQVQVDNKQLKLNIQEALKKQPSISLAELLQSFPLEQGLAELLSYIHLAAKSPKSIFDESQNEYILFDTETQQYLQVPKILYNR